MHFLTPHSVSFLPRQPAFGLVFATGPRIWSRFCVRAANVRFLVGEPPSGKGLPTTDTHRLNHVEQLLLGASLLDHHEDVLKTEHAHL